MFLLYRIHFVFVFFLYKTYSKRTDNVATLFHVTARNAQKRSAGKRIPVREPFKNVLADFVRNHFAKKPLGEMGGSPPPP